MRIEIASEYGRYLSSRRAASGLRERIYSAIPGCDGLVELDFAGVECLSGSFADEAIAVIAEQRGLSWLREHVWITNFPFDEVDTLHMLIAKRILLQAANSPQLLQVDRLPMITKRIPHGPGPAD